MTSSHPHMLKDPRIHAVVSWIDERYCTPKLDAFRRPTYIGRFECSIL